MPTLCFGGSFDPIHHGHLIVAQAIAEAAGFEHVLLVPTSQSPHKPDASLSSDTDRLRMIDLAIAGSQYFAVDDIEIRRGGRSFTIETARALRQTGWAQIHWLIGADMVPTLPTWREPASLLQQVQFVIAERPGHPINWQVMPEEFRVLEQWVVPAPRIDISSTAIRGRVAANKPIDFLTPPAVVRYIGEHGLYQTTST